MRIRQSIAGLTLAAAATAGALGLAAGPAAATAQNGLVNVHAQDIASGNQVILLQNVPVSVAANVCGVTANVISTQLLSSNQATCVAKSNSTTKSWVSFN